MAGKSFSQSVFQTPLLLTCNHLFENTKIVVNFFLQKSSIVDVLLGLNAALLSLMKFKVKRNKPKRVQSQRQRQQIYVTHSPALSALKTTVQVFKHELFSSPYFSLFGLNPNSVLTRKNTDQKMMMLTMLMMNCLY